MSLHITYNDGSNPFLVLCVDEKIIEEHVKWQWEHNKDLIEEIYIS